MKKPKNKKQITTLLLQQGYKATEKNIVLINQAIQQAEKEQGDTMTDLYIGYAWENEKEPLCIVFNGSSYKNMYFAPELEKEQDIKELLRGFINSYKDDLYNSVNINHFLIGELLNNKPSTLQQFSDEQEKRGLICDFVAYNDDKYWRFNSFIMQDKKADLSHVGCRTINNTRNRGNNEKARKEAQRIFYILSDENYFTTKTKKELKRRGNQYGYVYREREPQPQYDRLSDKYINQHQSATYNYYTDKHPYKYGLFGYSWQYGEQPTDKSGYFLPYFKEQLNRRLQEYKRQNALLRVQQLNKDPYIEQVNNIFVDAHLSIDELLKNYDSLYMKASFIDGVKALTEILNHCHGINKKIVNNMYDNIEQLINDIKELKQRAEKKIFFYNVERIKKYNYACMHQYEKIGDHYEMTEKYKKDAFFGDVERYAQVIY